MRTTKPKILRNLARIFPTFLRPVLFGVRKLACAFPEPEQLHTSKGGSTLPHSKEHSGPYFCLWLPCSVFIYGFVQSLLLHREIRGQFFTVALCLCGQ